MDKRGVQEDPGGPERYLQPYLKIRAEIPASVQLLAVSKGRPPEAIEALYRLGQRDFGENYVQELVEKAPLLEAKGCAGIRWHFIGRLQSNKINPLLPWVHSIHSVDSLRLARAIAQRTKTPLPCFLSVNIDREPSKSGFPPEAVIEAAREISSLSGISLAGLMCIPAAHGASSGGEASRPSFRALRELEKACHPYTQGGLSMGMSADYQVAIAEGTSVVRIGSLIFND